MKEEGEIANPRTGTGETKEDFLASGIDGKGGKGGRERGQARGIES